jgi:protein-S-isoprenylcysteine O-methyltransferase Ste14
MTTSAQLPPVSLPDASAGVAPADGLEGGPLYCGIVRWLARRRGLLVCLVAVAAAGIALASRIGPMAVVGRGAAGFWLFAWPLALAGAGIRLWAAGNLAKNAEVTRTGIYRLVRHPLYLGNTLIYGSFLLAVEAGGRAAPLLLAVLLLHYPRMLHEEQRLRREYPEQFATAAGTPRLLPDLRRLRDALATDRFCPVRAWHNRGWRGLWGPALLPVCAWALALARHA